MISPLSISNKLIERTNIEKNTSMTQLKLQKLLYLMYARFLALTGEPLFSQRFEAWHYGPVIPELYLTLKYFGAKPINKQISNVNALNENDLTGIFADCFTEVWNRYADFDVGTLIELTHGKAWKKAYDKFDRMDGAVLKYEDIMQDGINWFKTDEQLLQNPSVPKKVKIAIEQQQNEDKYLLKLYEKAMEEHINNPVTYSHEEMKRELGLINVQS